MKPTQIETDVALLQGSAVPEYRQIFIAFQALQQDIAALATENATLNSLISSLTGGLVVKKFLVESGGLDVPGPSEPVGTTFLYIFIAAPGGGGAVVFPDPPFVGMETVYATDTTISLVIAHKLASSVVVPATFQLGELALP